MGDKTTHFLLGALIGGILVGGYFSYRSKVKIRCALKDAHDTAHEEGYVEAHENFENLLAWGANNNASPQYLLGVIKGEVQVQ